MVLQYHFSTSTWPMTCHHQSCSGQAWFNLQQWQQCFGCRLVRTSQTPSRLCAQLLFLVILTIFLTGLEKQKCASISSALREPILLNSFCQSWSWEVLKIRLFFHWHQCPLTLSRGLLRPSFRESRSLLGSWGKMSPQPYSYLGL